MISTYFCIGFNPCEGNPSGHSTPDHFRNGHPRNGGLRINLPRFSIICGILRSTTVADTFSSQNQCFRNEGIDTGWTARHPANP